MRALQKYLATEHRKDCTIKRGGLRSFVSLDAKAAESRYQLEPVDDSRLNDKKSALFNAQSSGVLVGVEGFVTYDLDDGAGSRFTIHFDNPEVGSNSGDCSVEGAVSNRYLTKAIIGSGNHGAHMRYIIGQLNGPFSLRAFLTNTMPTGFDPNAPFTSIRNLQPPVTSISSFMKV